MNATALTARAILLFSAVLTASFTTLSAAQNYPVIVVTPSALEQPRAQAGIPITIIDSATIQKSNAPNLQALLRGQAGIHVSDLFGDGSQSRIDLRGFGPTAVSNTLILVDGRRLNNSTDTSAPDLSGIRLEDIEQIEILQGSAGVLYGNQAVGGVINIIRKKISSDTASVKLGAGSYDALKTEAAIHKLWGQTQLALSVTDSASDNYRQHNDRDAQHLALRLVRQHATFSAYVELESNDEFTQTPGALLEDEMDTDRSQSLAFYAEDYFDTRSDTIRAGIDKPFTESQSFKLDVSRRVDEREFIQTFRPYTGSLSTQDRDTRQVSGKYRYSADPLPLNLIIGLDLEQTDYQLVSQLGAQSIDQRIQDLYLSSQWKLSDSTQLQAGFRFSDQQADIAADHFDDVISVFSLGYSWTIDEWVLSARANQNFRFPTVEEHTNVPFGQAPGLKTQQGISYELGAEYSNGQRRYRASVYTLQLDDEIAFDSSGFANLNLSQTTRRGLILEAFNDWSDQFKSSLSLTLLNAEITDGAFDGKQLPLVPEKTLRLDASYQFSSSVLFSMELIAVDEQTLAGDFNNLLAKMPAYHVVNSNLAYHYKSWKLAVRVNNVLNEQYSESGSQYTEYDAVTFTPTHSAAYFPAPERNYWLTVKYTF